MGCWEKNVLRQLKTSTVTGIFLSGCFAAAARAYLVFFVSPIVWKFEDLEKTHKRKS